jgi:hypothetical protein
MANRKKEVYKPRPMTEGKRNLIQGLLQEYDIETEVAKKWTVPIQPLKVYMMCSLYASVQGINDSPFLPHRAVHGLQLLFITKGATAL